MNDLQSITKPPVILIANPPSRILQTGRVHNCRRYSSGLQRSRNSHLDKRYGQSEKGDDHPVPWPQLLKADAGEQKTRSNQISVISTVRKEVKSKEQQARSNTKERRTCPCCPREATDKQERCQDVPGVEASECNMDKITYLSLPRLIHEKTVRNMVSLATGCR